MNSAKYSFTRAGGRHGFFSMNNPSTDARNALQEWIGKNARSYDVLSDEDDELIAKLSFQKQDEAAGPDLDQACEKCGVERNFIQET